MRVAVTGAGGFIGSATVAALRDAGHEAGAHLGPEQFDICDLDAVRAFVRGSDVVVHLAGPASVSESFAQPAEFERVHAFGTATVLKAMEDAGIARVVYVSSADVYGPAGVEAVREERALEPGSPYAKAKAKAERLLQAAHRLGRVSGFIVRPFSIYGHGMHPNSLVATICAQAARSDDIYVNDLSPVRDYCFVADLAGLLVRAAERTTGELVVVNAAYGKGYSVAEVIGAVADACGRRLAGRERGPKRPAGVEITRLVADVTEAHRVLGWRASCDLTEGIKRSRLLPIAS
ncbi:MAG TPA: NAD(P)-dependent oxidoreductase [Candidatus Baltobacteraceae bacterium]|nr:NAD(P)-dependent oxidoreductase [Candidatus Baltobacteraceae bacterium]